MEEKRKDSNVMSKKDKVFLVALTVWIVLQIRRFMAIPLILSVNQGIDDPGWMYTAILDVVSATLAPFIAVAIWKYRGLGVWIALIAYFTLSIVDHGSGLTTYLLIGGPESLGMPTNSPALWLGPIIMIAIDGLFLSLIIIKKYRQLFFQSTDHAN
ncbi:MAG: hypothetical protein AAF702_10655 [Chloroflexota bacterium]